MKIAMASKTYMLLGAVLLAQFVPVAAMAEGRCPPGQYPIGGQGVGGCAPIPGAGQSGDGVAPTGRWETRWGAIASDAGHDTRKKPQLEWPSRKLPKLKRGG